jgi:TPR repeat protein
MSFKRTSEGRVFFQGTDGGANDGAPESRENFNPSRPTSAQPKEDAAPVLKAQKRSPASTMSGSMNESQTQMQIVMLLKTLNERLKSTQAERNSMRKELDAYRDLISDLENKADRSEKAYLNLQQKVTAAPKGGSDKAELLANEALKEMEETRKLLLDLEDKTHAVDSQIATIKTDVERHNQVGSQIVQKQKALEQAHQQSTQKVSEHTIVAAKLIQRVKTGEERYENLNDKIDQTGTEQARISRKLDKAIEERARFMRKIERIEETVLQTRDSLNAKAMVLLTDQDVAPADSIQPQIDAAILKTQRQEAHAAMVAEKSSWWRALYSGKTIMIVSLLVAATIATGLLSTLRIPEMPAISMPNFNAANTSESTAPEAQSQQYAPSRNIDGMSEKWDTTTPQAATPKTAAIQTPNFSDDIGALDLNDQAQVKAAIEGNSEALAIALNNIEPGNAPAAVIEEPAAPAEAAPAPKAVEQIITPPAQITPDLSEALNLSDKVENPANLIKPDRALKDVIKNIENQAFEGVAEAQHDLAAIYTAGHGGVAQNYDRARFWFEQAAARGIDNASYNLGVIFHQGLGTNADMGTALKWYAHAAKLGHPEAQYNLGIAYIEGIGVPYDPAKATSYFTSAANNQIMEAAYNLGLIYENGLLGNAKPDEALMWYKIAADQGSPEANQALEQLAQTLGIDTSEVNRIAEDMKSRKQPAATPKAEPTATNSRAPATIEDTRNVAAVTTPNAALTRQVLVAQMQEYLMQIGLYPGPADGIEGPLTADAVRSYQRQNDLVANGQASQKVLNHMMETLDQGSRF